MSDAAPSASAPRRTVAEQVYGALRSDILTLRHRPGAWLTEQALAEAYGASRAPVREACRRLQQEGLLTSIPYRGYFVSPISLQEIHDCFELRLALETQAVELAMTRARGDELAGLAVAATADYTHHDPASYGAFLERNLAFHLRIASLSSNRRLVAVLGDLLAAMQRFFYLGLDLGDFGTEMRREHQRLVELMRAGRRDEAVSCLRGQIEMSRDRIVRALADGRFPVPLE